MDGGATPSRQRMQRAPARDRLEGLCVFDPPSDLVAEFGLSDICGEDERVLWLGTPSRSALMVCGLSRLGAFIVIDFVLFAYLLVHGLASTGLSDRNIRALLITPVLTALLAFVLFASTRPVVFSYALTSKRLIIKLRRDASRFRLSWVQTRRFRSVADPLDYVAYPYEKVTTLTVRRWFFDVGNFDLRDFALTEPGATRRASSRQAVKRLISRFTLFPGGNYGGSGYTPSASPSAGFYGIRRVSRVAALLQRQLTEEG